MRLVVTVGMRTLAEYHIGSEPGEIRVRVLPWWLSWVPGLGVDIQGKTGSNVNISVSIRT